MIQAEWEHWQADNQTTAVLTGLEASIVNASPEDRLSQLVAALDPNSRPAPFTGPDCSNRQSLEASRSSPPLRSRSCPDHPGCRIGAGPRPSGSSWRGMWSAGFYENSRQSLGFGGDIQQQQGPWSHWAKLVSSPALQQLFGGLGPTPGHYGYRHYPPLSPQKTGSPGRLSYSGYSLPW